MLDGLRDLHARLDQGKLRAKSPKHTVFLCGGLVSQDVNETAFLSVRDYLFRVKKIEERIGASIILAEEAKDVYRATNYRDLISFEEDIARIASIVLVISESPGSLAELGAFASEAVIRESLRIIVSETHNLANSFVRYGPIQRIENINRNRLGVFPWKNQRSSGNLIKSSIKPHFREIVTFIKDGIKTAPLTHTLALVPDKAIFYNILWILSVLEVCPPEPLYDAVRLMHPAMSDPDIKNRLYALRVCKWVGTFAYSGRDYYYLPENRDPFEYAFLPGLRIRDVAAAKLDISLAFKKAANITRPVYKRLLSLRGSGV